VVVRCTDRTVLPFENEQLAGSTCVLQGCEIWQTSLTWNMCKSCKVLDTLAWAERDLLLAYPRCADANVFVHLNSTSQVGTACSHLGRWSCMVCSGFHHKPRQMLLKAQGQLVFES
jgi:hypothetical protein